MIVNQTLSADGSTTAKVYPAGVGQFTLAGSFGGGTCTLQWSPDNVTYYTLGIVINDGTTATSFTGVVTGTFATALGWIRGTLTGSSSPSLKVMIGQVSGRVSKDVVAE